MFVQKNCDEMLKDLKSTLERTQQQMLNGERWSSPLQIGYTSSSNRIAKHIVHPQTPEASTSIHRSLPDCRTYRTSGLQARFSGQCQYPPDFSCVSAM